MPTNIQEPALLFRTSLATDVQCSGGNITVAGLPSVRKSRITNFTQVKGRAEVVQVVTVGATSYTPTGSTDYNVLIGDTNRSRNGSPEQLKRYTYPTPADVTTLGNAAAQREAIHADLVSKINQDTSNFVTAVSLGSGNGFTITDDAGYYPVFSQTGSGRKGASQVLLAQNENDSGFAVTNIAITTPATYSFGLGANLAAGVPVVDALYGGLLSGYLYGATDGVGPKTSGGLPAVSGQVYDAFVIEYNGDQSAFGGATNSYSLVPKVQTIFVDNGTGTATTNLAGFIAFEREMHRMIEDIYSKDPSSVIEFFDKNFVIQGPLGAVPATTTSITNKFITDYGSIVHVNIGTQTIVAPTQGANGLLIEQDATATEGAQYSANVSTVTPKQYVVGKQPITHIFQFSATTVANIVIMAGLRTKAAFTLDFNDYTNLAAVGTGPSGTDIYSYGILGNAATVATDSTLNAADATVLDIRIQIGIDGAVSAYANNTKINIYSAGTTALVFAAGTILVPFFQYTNLNSAAAVPNVTKFITVPTDTLVI